MTDSDIVEKKLVQKAKELETITGCTVTSFDVIVPPGKDYRPIDGHRSANAAAKSVNTNHENPQPAPSHITSPPLSTPQKNLAGKKNKQTTTKPSENRCSICCIEFRSQPDKEWRSLWMKCTFNENASGGCTHGA